MVRLGAQTIQNVVTYTAVIGVENRDRRSSRHDGQYSDRTEERSNALRVPNAALRFRPPGRRRDQQAPPHPLGKRRRPDAVAPAPSPRCANASKQSCSRLPEAGDHRHPRGARGPGRAALAGLSEDERRAAFRAARSEMRTKISAALDPERRAKFEAMVEEGRAALAKEDPGIPGRVYVLDGEGQPKVIQLMLGPTDGAYTEIVSSDLKEGMQVLVGGGPRSAARKLNPPAAQRYADRVCSEGSPWP